MNGDQSQAKSARGNGPNLNFIDVISGNSSSPKAGFFSLPFMSSLYRFKLEQYPCLVIATFRSRPELLDIDAGS